MSLFEGKKGLILGVANDRSIAWAIAKEIMDNGANAGLHICQTAQMMNARKIGCESKNV